MNLILDYDGTLHESLVIYAPAFRCAYSYLISEGYMEDKPISDDDIAYWLGFSSKEMWDTFCPALPQDVKLHCGAIIGEAMLRMIEGGCAKLYSGTIDVLSTLHAKNHNLIFLSNCGESYMQAHKKQFSLERYFSGFYCTQTYDYAPKEEIFPYIKQEFDGDFIVIGDRLKDISLAKTHGLCSVGCTYGYGSKEELADADIRIDSITQLPEAITCLIDIMNA